MTAPRRCGVCSRHHSPKCRAVTDRWPLADLVSAAAATGHRTIRDVRNYAGASGDDWHRAERDGLTDRDADHWAIRLGLLPGEVWDGWYAAGLSALDDLRIHHGGWRPAWLFAEGCGIAPTGLAVGHPRPSVENVA